MTEKLPEFTVEMRTPALKESDRRWVPLRKSKYHVHTFPNWDAAEEYMNTLRRLHPHLELKVVPIEWNRTTFPRP